MSIDPQMTLLDTVAAHPETVAVFRVHGERVGVCILCEALFETIEGAAKLHGLDLKKLLKDLEQAVGENSVSNRLYS